MRVTCLIDSLGSGGAQRQLVMLAVLLQNRGHRVSMVTYHPLEPPFDFFLSELQNVGITCKSITAGSRFARMIAIRRALRSTDQDVVLAFLDASCLYAELSALPWRRWGLVVSERADLAGTRSDRPRIALHRLADCVTTNSHSCRAQIERLTPQLQGRVATIYNAVDLGRFYPPERKDAGSEHTRSHGQDTVRLVAAASYHSRKNLDALVEAMAILRRANPDLRVRLDWYGDYPVDPETGRKMTDVHDAALNLVTQRGLTNLVVLNDVCHSIADIYRSADAVILPSLREGVPNTICEAMACGRPVLMSAIGDARFLVSSGENGFLFDPGSPEEIAAAILEFCRLPSREREVMGQNSRRVAETLFCPDEYADRYVRILASAAARRRPNLSGLTL